MTRCKWCRAPEKVVELRRVNPLSGRAWPICSDPVSCIRRQLLLAGERQRQAA